MKRKEIRIHEAIYTDDDSVTIVRICEQCGIPEEEVTELMDEGIISPEATADDALYFSADTIGRIFKVKRLKRDLELNMAGVALAMNLLDRIEELERKIRRLEL